MDPSFRLPGASFVNLLSPPLPFSPLGWFFLFPKEGRLKLISKKKEI
jgi:hypothetical protein